MSPRGKVSLHSASQECCQDSLGTIRVSTAPHHCWAPATMEVPLETFLSPGGGARRCGQRPLSLCHPLPAQGSCPTSCRNVFFPASLLPAAPLSQLSPSAKSLWLLSKGHCASCMGLSSPRTAVPAPAQLLCPKPGVLPTPSTLPGTRKSETAPPAWLSCQRGKILLSQASATTRTPRRAPG